MKRFLAVVLVCVLCVCSASAWNGEFLSIEDMEFAAEFDAMIPELVEQINVGARERGLSEITAQDIDLETMYPYYAGGNYFDPEIQNADDFLKLISNQEYYLWILPLEIDGEYIQVAIGRTRPVREGVEDVLTEDELAALEAKVGKWSYKWASYGGIVEKDWKAVAVSENPDADQIVLVNGLESTYSVMAVCVKDGRLTEVISVTDTTIPVDKADTAALMTRSNLHVSEQGEIVLEIGERFTYEELQQTLGRLEPDQGSFLDGGGGSFRLNDREHNTGLLLVLPVILLAIIAVFMKKYHVHNKKAEENK